MSRYLPEFGAVLDGPDGPATLADLLTHRAGLWEWWPTYLTRGDDPLEVVRVAAAALSAAERSALLRPGVHDPRPDRSKALPRSHFRTAHRDAGRAHPAGIDGLRYAAPPAGLTVAASSRGDVIERRMLATGCALSGRRAGLPGHGGPGRIRPVARSGRGGRGQRRQRLSCLRRSRRTCRAVRHGGCPARSWAAGCSPGWPGTTRMTAVRRFVVAGPDPGQALGFRLWTSRAGDVPGAGDRPHRIPGDRRSASSRRIGRRWRWPPTGCTSRPANRSCSSRVWAASLDAAHAADGTPANLERESEWTYG